MNSIKIFIRLFILLIFIALFEAVTGNNPSQAAEGTNSAPGIPTINTPPNGGVNANEVTTLRPNLVVNAVTDADGDPVTYEFAISKVSDFTTIDASATGIAAAGGLASWTAPALAENTLYYWRARATDGKTDGDWMTAGTFFVSTANIAPNVPTVVSPPVDGEADSITPMLSVQATDVNHDPLTYEFAVYTTSSLNPQTQVAAAVDQASTWRVTPSLVDNTRYYWIARAKDSHGIYSVWTAVNSFTVKNKGDNLPPVMQVNAPGANDLPTKANSYTISWSASDPDSPAFITLYYDRNSFTFDGSQSVTTLVSGLGTKNGDPVSYAWNTSALADGAYYVYAKIEDGKSAVYVSAAGPLTIDRTGPNAPQVTGVAQTNSTAPLWTWSSGGGGGNGTFRYKLDDSNLTTGATETTALNFTPSSALNAASHILYVQERDVAGNWSTSGRYTILIDLAPPGTAISGQPANPTNVKNGSFTFSSPDSSASFECSLDNAAYEGCSSPLNFDFSTGADGSHSFSVRAVDQAGNVDPTPASYSWTIDTAAPDAPAVSGITPTNNTRPTWSWTSGGGSGTYRYRLDEDNFAGGGTETTATTYTSALVLNEGSHTLYVQERDAAGNWSASGSFAIVVDGTMPMVINAMSTLADGTYGAGTAVDITLNFSEPISSNGLSINLNSGAVINTGILDKAASFSGTYIAAPGENSADLSINSITGTIADAAGNNLTGPGIPAGSNIADTKNIVIDTTAPAVSGATSATPDGAYKTSSTIDITVNFTEPVSSEGLKIMLNSGAAIDTGKLTNITSFNGSYTVGDGQNSADLGISGISGAIADSVANVTTNPAVPGGKNITDGKAIIVDTVAPTITGVTSSTPNGSYNEGRDIDVTITFSELVSSGTLSISLNTGAVIDAVITNPVATFSVKYTVAAGHTVANLDVSTISGTITDAAGNSVSNPVIPGGHNLADAKTIQVDTTAPSLIASASYVDATHVELAFSEVVNGATSNVNYSADNGLKITGAVSLGSSTYRLTTSPQVIGTKYTITARPAIADPAGNPVLGSANTAGFTRPSDSNSAPGVPSLNGPPTGALPDTNDMATPTPTLVVNAATDPDSDPITYTFEVSATSDFATLVTSAGGIAATGPTASWTVSPPLDENTVYYWRVHANDGYRSGEYMPAASFFVNSTNDLPAGLAVSAPTNNTQVATVTPILAVTNAGDADRDPLTYEFTVATDSVLADKVADAGIVQGDNGSTSWTVPAGKLKDNTWYYWQCRARDSHGAYSEPVTASFFVNTQNDAPSAPTLNLPLPGSFNNNEVATPTPTLVINNATDPDGYNQTLLYTFEIDTTMEFSSAGKQTALNINGGTGTTSWIPQPLADNTTWYWRAKASDGMADGPWMETGSFFVNTRNDAPNMPTVTSPVNNGEADSLSPILTVSASDIDHDPLTYEFAVYSDSTLNPDKLVASGGMEPSWIVSTPLVDNTRYYWIARAKDSHGDFSRWTAVSSFTVKNKGTNLAPSMTITAPGVNEPVTNAKSYTIRWNAVDPDSPAFITLYRATDASGTGGAPIASGLSKDAGSYTWDTSKLADGSYYVYGLIADGKTSVTAVSAGPIVIDRTPPSAPEVSGAALTNSPTPTWSWSSKGGGIGIYRLKLGNDDFTTGGTETGNLTFTPASGLSGTAHTLYVQERDEAGNWSPSGSYETVIDLFSPTATISGAPDRATNNTGVTLAVSGDGVAAYRYSVDSGNLSDEKPVGNPIQLGGLGHGTHTVAVIGRDSAGNWQTTATTVQWEIDTIPPEAVISVPPNPANTSAASLAVGGSEVTAYRYKVDGGAFSRETPISTPITISSLAEGSHTVAAIGRDSAGNWQPEASATAVAWTVDLTPPAMDLSTLPDGANTNVAELNLSGTVTDANGIANLVLKYIAGGAAGSGEIIVDGKGSFSHILTLTAGANKLTLLATDRAGNPTSNTRTINYDPFGPKLTITSPADNLKTNSTLIDISGVTDKPATIEITVYGRDEKALPSQLLPVTDGKFAATCNLTEGMNTVVITAQDLTGNRSSYKRTVTFDNGKPTLAIIEPAQDLRTDLSVMTIKGTVADALSEVSVMVKQDDRGPETVSLNNNGTGQSFEKAVTFTENRVYHLVVTATDAAGNESSVQRNIIYSKPARGDINNDGRVDVLDALIALQISTGMLTQSDSDLIHGDVAPLISGKPVSDGRIDVGDAVVILEAVVGLITL